MTEHSIDHVDIHIVMMDVPNGALTCEELRRFLTAVAEHAPNGLIRISKNYLRAVLYDGTRIGPPLRWPDD